MQFDVVVNITELRAAAGLHRGTVNLPPERTAPPPDGTETLLDRNLSKGEINPL